MIDHATTCTVDGIMYRVGYVFVSMPTQFDPPDEHEPAWKSGVAMCSSDHEYRRNDNDDN